MSFDVKMETALISDGDVINEMTVVTRVMNRNVVGKFYVIESALLNHNRG